MSSSGSTQLKERPHPAVVERQLKELGRRYYGFDELFDEPDIVFDVREDAGLLVSQSIPIPTRWEANRSTQRKADLARHYDVFVMTMASTATSMGDASFAIPHPNHLSPLDQVIRDLGRLRDGWAGDHTHAPSARVLNDIKSAAVCLSRETKSPNAEVDPDDGSVVLRWANEGFTETMSLTFPGDGTVIGYLSLDEGSAPAWRISASDATKLTIKLDNEKVSHLIAG